MDDNQAEDNKPIFRRLYERVFPDRRRFLRHARRAERERCGDHPSARGIHGNRRRDGEPEGPRRRARSRPDQGRQPQCVERRLLDTGRPRRPLPRDHHARRHRELLQVHRRRDGHAGLQPDKHSLQIALHIREGTDALAKGFARLATDPAGAGLDANAARKAERTVEKSYRRAITELFQGDDYLNMFKRRETYRHLSNAADRVADAARALDNIVVKLC
jgi:hypothetical protein